MKTGKEKKTEKETNKNSTEGKIRRGLKGKS